MTEFGECTRSWLVAVLLLVALGVFPVRPAVAGTDEATGIYTLECDDIEFHGAEFVTVEFDHKSLRLIGVRGNGKRFLIGQATPKHQMVGIVDDADCKGNRIFVTVKQAFHALYVTQEFVWNGKQLRQVKSRMQDFSRDAIEAALDAALSGQMDQARLELGNVMYPSRYFGCWAAADVLKRGHHASLRRLKSGGLSATITALGNTIDLMLEIHKELQEDELATLFNTAVPERWQKVFHDCEMPQEVYISALNDYGYLLQLAHRNDEAVTVLRSVIAERPDRAVAYLNLGDALWQAARHTEARSSYAIYVDLMRNGGKAARIPAATTSRLRAQGGMEVRP
ncbi:MAG: tetratricopeptide repeat protein [Rhodocyclaceae bacterium]|nr:tetratricopeptide repeat protein [Rhodocyclaceae bacterium]